MHRCLTFLLYWIVRFLISLRYRVKVVGLEQVVAQGKTGIIFLPNHPAEIDPLIVESVLWSSFKPHPLVIEQYYYQKGLRPLMDLVGVVPVPDMDVTNKWKIKQIEKAKQALINKLDKGENLLIYPSGKLKVGAEERIGGTFLVSDLLQVRPAAKVVLVRTTGLWGSMFSKALTGMSPDFGKTLLEGAKMLLKNGIFFAPRRQITIELEISPADFPRAQEKQVLNKWLENWYNKRGGEQLSLVSYLFWKKELGKVVVKELPKEELNIPEEVRGEILGHLSKITHRPIPDLQPTLHLSNDLALDSLDLAELYVFLEERFRVEGLAFGQLQTIYDLLAATQGKKKESTPSYSKKAKWPVEKKRLAPAIPEGETIPEVFLNSCNRMGQSIACADNFVKAMSYRKLKMAALVLSLKIKEMEGEYIGILLPSLVGGYVVILATLLAGKIPVMLNWTTGVRNLEHAAKLCSLKVILSSYRFLSRLDNCDLGNLDPNLLLMEEVRNQISFKEKVKGLLLSFRKTKSLLKILPAMTKDATAVVIFTSGTEALPKAVPLTHHNLLSNQRATLDCIRIFAEDSLYGVLPPFHSFGFSVTGLLPILAGVKVCFAPDPTDSRALANDIAHWKPTIFCAAPSFIQSVVRVATEEQLKSLRLVVSGAEKMPQELFDTLRAKGKKVLEGYGISECSPVVTLDREDEPHKGVGKPLPNMSLCIIKEGTNERLRGKEEGEVCISGPSVFNGYLGLQKEIFFELDQKKWYRSGDRGYLAEDGTLFLTGRLKRFFKIGGEMISLAGLEEDLVKLCKEKGWAANAREPILALVISGRESDKSQIVLFTTFDLDRDKINQAIKEMGHGRLIKVADVHKIKEIPLSGVGKTQYRLLEEMLLSNG